MYTVKVNVNRTVEKCHRNLETSLEHASVICIRLTVFTRHRCIDTIVKRKNVALIISKYFRETTASLHDYVI